MAARGAVALALAVSQAMIRFRTAAGCLGRGLSAGAVTIDVSVPEYQKTLRHSTLAHSECRWPARSGGYNIDHRKRTLQLRFARARRGHPVQLFEMLP
jgi:hypothetical protein